MNCKYYSSMESYYGVAGSVPTMTSGFWECEPEVEDLEEYFLKWQDENGELLEPGYPSSVSLYCNECEDYMDFDATPSEVWNDSELYKINLEAIKKWKKQGDIDDEDEKELIEELNEMFTKEAEKQSISNAKQ